MADESSTGGGIVLFDGTCAFCTGSVAFIARRDPAGYFRFGASESPEGTAMLARMGMTQVSARSLVLIEDGHVFLRSTAALRIARRLTGPWRASAWLLAVPRPLRDAVYRVVAAMRHRVAGRVDVCTLPPPEIRSRLL